MDPSAAPRSSVGIVGAGRLGRVAGRALQGAGLDLVAAHSRSEAGRRIASEALGVEATASPVEVLRAAELVLLCVPDDALATIADELAAVEVPRRTIAMMSGAVPLAALAPLRERRHLVVRVHPLRALGSDATPADLVGAPGAVGAHDDEGFAAARLLADRLGLVPFELDEAGIGVWHAAATMAGNHTLALVADARDLAIGAGLDRDAALAAFGGLARHALARAIEETPERALTGPVSRGDAGTVATHLRALGEACPQLVPAYRELGLRTLALARVDARVAADEHASTEAVLGAARPVVVEGVAALRELLASPRRAGLRVGFVPTMGALHEGHAALVRAARDECDVVVVSCFVNPTQFGPNEDLDRYPRTPERDEEIVRRAAGDVLWRPGVHDVYGEAPEAATSIRVGPLGSVLEGRARPGHFDGVASVVVRLLGAVQPDVLYLGAKDYQQVAVLRTVIRDLAIAVELRTIDTVREPDGLARSSRNAYLSGEERQAALAIAAALDAASDLLADGERSGQVIRDAVLARLGQAQLVEVDYVALVDPETLEPLAHVAGEAMLLVAARVGATRLIDNARLVTNRQEVPA